MLGSIKKGGKTLRTNLYGEISLYIVNFDSTGGTNDPDGVDPAENVTVAHAGTAGDYTITFDETVKPKNIPGGWVNVGSDAGFVGVFTGYTASTGVATITVSDGGTAANVADNVNVQVFLVLGHNSLTDPA